MDTRRVTVRGEIIGGSSNGRTPGFGPEYLGSNPSPPARLFVPFLLLF